MLGVSLTLYPTAHKSCLFVTCACASCTCEWSAVPRPIILCTYILYSTKQLESLYIIDTQQTKKTSNSARYSSAIPLAYRLICYHVYCLLQEVHIGCPLKTATFVCWHAGKFLYISPG